MSRRLLCDRKLKSHCPRSWFSQVPESLGCLFTHPDNVERDLLTSKCSGAEQTWSVRSNKGSQVNSRVSSPAHSCFCDTQSHGQAAGKVGGCFYKNSFLVVAHCMGYVLRAEPVKDGPRFDGASIASI